MSAAESTRDDGGPAFPEAGMSGLPNGEFIHGRAGMTLRDYFAAKALPAVYAEAARDCSETGWPTGWRTAVALDAYRLSDEMLKARQV